MENSQERGNAWWVLLAFFVPLVSLFVGCTIEAVEAADQHQIGGPPGWSLPSRSNVNYTLWASNQTFRVGDTLYFNYSSDYHNVLEVSEANYGSCNAVNPIKKWESGEDIIALNSSGTFYYLCGITGHCAAGQKVAVAVVAATTGTRHQVGGTPGWSLPSKSNVNYTDWASNQTFLVGDTLYFNYSSQYHNVLQVTKAKYDTCNATDPIELWDDGATTITLNTTGTFYYICGIPGHCAAGQKVAVTVATSLGGSPLSPGGSPTAAPGSGGASSPGGSSPTPGASGSHPSHPMSPLSGLLLPISLIFTILASSFGYPAALH